MQLSRGHGLRPEPSLVKKVLLLRLLPGDLLHLEAPDVVLFLLLDERSKTDSFNLKGFPLLLFPLVDQVVQLLKPWE